MSVQRLIPERRLAELLGLDPHVLVQLRSRRRLHSDARRDMVPADKITELMEDPQLNNSVARSALHYYTLATIDRLFSAPGIARHFTGPLPTAEQLLAGDDSLLSITQVCEMLDKDQSEMQGVFIDGGYLPSLNLFYSQLRIPASAAAKLHANLNNDSVNAVREDDAAIILGVHPSSIDALVRDPHNPLERAVVAGKGDALYVTRGSLRKALRELLPDHIAITDWWRHRIHYRDKLITIDELEELCYARRGSLFTELIGEVILHITTPGGPTRIPLRAVRHWVSAAAPISAEELAKIFGTSRITQAALIQLCAIHYGRTAAACPRHECIVRYIEEHRTRKKVDPESWIEAALENNAVPVIATEFLAEHHEVSQEDIDTALASDQLTGVWLPRNSEGVSELALSPTEALALLRAARKRQRRMEGPGYHRWIDGSQY